MSAAKAVTARERTLDLYGRIGQFLARHGLSADPAHYAFAHAVLTASNGALAAEVERLTDGGVRLSSQEIERLGGIVVAGVAVESASGDDQASALVARTHLQVEGFAELVDSIHAETSGFGRDLKASTDGMPAGGDVARIAAVMLARIQRSETRLAAAREETQVLRVELEQAIGNARRDPLTGLPNRRAFEEAVAAVSPGTPCAIAICDVDHFKEVNDAFGHEVGDRVLTAIGAALSDACAPHMVARHGGEEFTILFAGMLMGDAHRVLVAACETIAAKRYRVRDTDARLGAVTLSAGIAAACIAEHATETLARADGALYVAKKSGRNRVEIAP